MARKTGKNKISLILHDGAWDRVYYGLSVALAALATGAEVHALFTFGALKRLVKGRADEVSGDTAPEVQRLVQNGPVRGKLPSIAELLGDASALGIKLYVCPAAMAFLGINKEDLIAGADSVMGLTGFLEMSRGADLSYYI
ncbi:MAG: DsrE/DsrF/DrsH-like family protein [Chloroflexi bacterium]|nr:DsrE/DsrF/DrsH-like family protein [Chloroflexota bacterium]